MNKAIYMTDKEITLSRRKAASFGEFVTAIHPSALRFAAMLLGSHASVAPDVVQKAFLAAWNKQHQQKEPNKLPPGLGRLSSTKSAAIFAGCL